MGLVEAVIGELVEKVPHLLRLGLVDALLLRALQELGALGVHRRLDLLAHGPAQEVGAAERIARHLLRDLHHLFLVDDDALRLVEDVVDQRVDALALPEPVLDLAILGNVLHRARAVERHEGDDVLDAGRLHAAQRVHHARRFHLEHRDRPGRGVEAVGRLVVERDLADIVLGAGVGRVDLGAVGADVQRAPLAVDQVERVLHHGQRLESEEVELYQPRLLDPFHVELGRRHLRPRVLVERHQRVERAVADHHARGVGRGVAQQPLDLLAVGEQAVDRLVLRLLAQARLVGQRLLDRDGLDPLDRDQLGQAVDLTVGQLQHPAHVAHGGFRQERAEGDDLRHLLAAVAALYIVDHLLPPVHAEVDVEIGHRHPLGVQEALEEQVVTQWIEVGNRQRIGDEAARARAAAGTDGNVAILGPLDEIRHDEEVAGKAHPLDDAQLEVEPSFVFVNGRGVGDDGQTCREPLLRLSAQLFHLVVGKAWQDRVARLGAVMAAPRDLHRVLQRLGQVGEERGHLFGRLEVVLRCQHPAGRRLVDIGALADADQRVVRFVHARLREIDVVGGHQRQVAGVGDLDMAALRQPLGLGQPVFAGVALQLDVKARGEGGGEAGHQRLGLRPLARSQQAPHRAVGAAGEADDALRVALELVDRHAALLPVVPQVKARLQLHQVAVARLVLREQDDRRGRHRLFSRRGLGIGKVDLGAHDRLHPLARRADRELERGEHRVGVGHRDGRHAHAGHQARQRLEPHGAFEQRILAVNAQMNESGRLAHAPDLACPLPRRHQASTPAAPKRRIGHVNGCRLGSARRRTGPPGPACPSARRRP
ncbi:MAG: hypothetical protein HLUCCA09_02175 [Rhodobacteraceae bacterium HLUCCA09]|nr:MAG: hypothetical protein HLUCCA09_02175 [Rhodobacteraceae bacterium HLUCCA09]